ncbi:MAG: hypothetical protein EOP06_21610 [Proteobacteria bacterium]|nr:MAG: hypothetical protein EOP06_21610 [Pseudomonadota bacterium]
MHKLITTLATLGFLGAAPQIYAQSQEVFRLKAKAISSNSNFKSNSVQMQGAGGTRVIENSDNKANAMGYGLDLDFAIGEYGHLGAEVNYIDYVNDSEKVSYTDLSPAVYGAVDVYKDQNYAIFAKVGVSYHDLDLKDTKTGGLTVSYEDLDLWNYDAAVGLNSALTKTVNLGLEYKYTGSFVSDGVDLTYNGFGLAPTPERLKDIKLMKNEVTASIGVLL